MNKTIANNSGLVTFIFSVLGVVYILFITHHYNLVISGMDGVNYLSGARNIIAGNGFTIQTGDGTFSLIPFWPPLYSMVLAFTGFISGMDCMEASRYLAAILFGFTFLMFNLCINKIKINYYKAIVLNILLLISPAFSEYLSLASESLFIFLLARYSVQFKKKSLLAY